MGKPRCQQQHIIVRSILTNSNHGQTCQTNTCVCVFLYLYLCICICVLVFEYLYLCVQGRQHVIVWSILTNTNHVQTCQHRREPKTAQFSGVELSCFSPQILLSVLHCYTVTNQILLSVLQPFFCRRWVSMAPSCSPNLSLSPPRPAPNYPADPVSLKTAQFSLLSDCDLQLEVKETKPKDKTVLILHPIF